MNLNRIINVTPISEKSKISCLKRYTLDARKSTKNGYSQKYVYENYCELFREYIWFKARDFHVLRRS
jgi:hypothetical protein